MRSRSARRRRLTAVLVTGAAIAIAAGAVAWTQPPADPAIDTVEPTAVEQPYGRVAADDLAADDLAADDLAADDLVAVAAAAGPSVPGDLDADVPGADVGPGTAAVVRLALGEDFAAAAAGRAPGTTYVVEPGVHRQQTLELQAGDRVIGLPGAVMSGAEVIDAGAFVRAEDDRWVLAGRTEEPFRTPEGQLHGEMEAGRERDAANHDLWLDDRRAVHAPTREDVDAPGEWFFDYDADQVVLFEDPSGVGAIELAVTQYAIGSDGADLHIADLTITRYATPAQGGAIHAFGGGWLLEDLAVTDNHGAGVWLGHDSTLRSSRITGNGQIGVTSGDADRVLLEDNEIAGNGVLGYEWGWEAGGLKLKEGEGTQVVDNWVHGNAGPGIWFDIDNRAGLVRGNLVEDNDVTGILIEISDGLDVTGNVVRRNGSDGEYGHLGAGITVSNSSNVVVRGNALSDNAHEVIAINYDRSGPQTRGLVVSGNDITIRRPESVGVYDDTRGEASLQRNDLRFDDNTYVLDGCEPCFLWEGSVTAEGWQDLGNDADGRFVVAAED